jgi:hypothetical protein
MARAPTQSIARKRQRIGQSAAVQPVDSDNKFVGVIPAEEVVRLFADGFNAGGHRASAAADFGILAVGMYLIALQLGMLSGRRQHNGFATVIDFFGDLEALYHGVAKKLLQHGDDVFERMILVVPQNDIVSRLPLGFLLLPYLFLEHGLLDRLGHSDVRLVCHAVTSKTACDNSRIASGPLYCRPAREASARRSFRRGRQGLRACPRQLEPPRPANGFAALALAYWRQSP